MSAVPMRDSRLWRDFVADLVAQAAAGAPNALAAMDKGER
jgi:hypothetical protein